MKMADDEVLQTKPSPIQRKCKECEEEEKQFQHKCDACEKEDSLQKKSDTVFHEETNDDIERNLSASKFSGSPIPEDIRTQMESSFGAYFSNVRIHNDSSAVRMNKDLHAQAFHGSDIYFNSGKFDTNSKNGNHLLAHELTHTINNKMVSYYSKTIIWVKKYSANQRQVAVMRIPTSKTGRSSDRWE